MKTVNKSVLIWYSAEEMYALVTDVEKYPQFLPWCDKARVIEEDEAGMTAEVGLAFAGLHQSFTTRNTVDPPHRLQMSLVDGPFRSLEGVWDFIALGDAGCKINFALDFDYAGGLAGAALKLGFQGLASRMVEDFCREAERAYG